MKRELDKSVRRDNRACILAALGLWIDQYHDASQMEKLDEAILESARIGKRLFGLE